MERYFLFSIIAQWLGLNLLGFLAPAAPSCAYFFKFDLQWLAAIQVAIQAGDGGPGFMAFHADKTEASALTAENIRDKLNRAYGTVLRK